VRGLWCCDTRVFANRHEGIEVLCDLAKFQEERAGIWLHNCKSGGSLMSTGNPCKKKEIVKERAIGCL